MATIKSLRKQHPSLVSTAFSEVSKPGTKKTTKKVAPRSSKPAAKKSDEFDINNLVEKGETLYILADDGTMYQVKPGVKTQRSTPMQQVANLKKRETRIKSLIRQARAEAKASSTNGVYKASGLKAAEGVVHHPLADARIHEQTFPENGYYFEMEDGSIRPSSEITEDTSSRFISPLLEENMDEEELLAKMEKETELLCEEEKALLERLEREGEFLKRAKQELQDVKIKVELDKLRLKKRHDELARSYAAATHKKTALRVIKTVMEEQHGKIEKDCKRVNQQKLEEEKFKKLLADALDMQIERKKMERKRRQAKPPTTNGRLTSEGCTQTPFSWDAIRPPSTPKPSGLPTRKASYRTTAPGAPTAQNTSENKGSRESQRSLYKNLKRCHSLLGATMERVAKYMRKTGGNDEEILEIASEISQRFTDSFYGAGICSSKGSMRSKKSSDMKLPSVDTSSRVNLTAAQKPKDLEATARALKEKLSSGSRKYTMSISASTRSFLKEEWSKVLQETKESKASLKDLKESSKGSTKPVPSMVPKRSSTSPKMEKKVIMEGDTQGDSVAPAPTENASNIREKEEEKTKVDDVLSENKAMDFPSATTLGMLSENWSNAANNKTLDLDDTAMCDAGDSFYRPPTPPVYHAPLMRHVSRMPASNMSLRSIKEHCPADFTKEFSSPLICAEKHVVPYQSLTTRFGLHLVDLPAEVEAGATEAMQAEDLYDEEDNSPLYDNTLDDNLESPQDDSPPADNSLDDSPPADNSLDESPPTDNSLDESPQDGNSLDESPQDDTLQEEQVKQADQTPSECDSAIIAYEVMNAESGDELDAAPTLEQTGSDDIDSFEDNSTVSSAAALSKRLTQTTSLHRAQRFSDPNMEEMAVNNSPISPLTSTASTGKLVTQLSSTISSVSLHSAPEEREIHFPHGVEEEDSLIAITILHEPTVDKAEKPFVTLNKSDPGPMKQVGALEDFVTDMAKKAEDASDSEDAVEASVAVEASAAAVESRNGSPALPNEVEQPSPKGSVSDLTKEASAASVKMVTPVTLEDTSQQTAEKAMETSPKVSSSSLNETVPLERIITTSFSRSVSKASLKSSATPAVDTKADSSTVTEKNAETSPKVSRTSSEQSAPGDFIITTSFSQSVSRASVKSMTSTTEMTKQASIASVKSKKGSNVSLKEAVQASPKASATEVTKEASIASVKSKKGSNVSLKEAVQASPKASATEVTKEASIASVKSKKGSNVSLKEVVQASPKASATEVTKEASIASIKRKKRRKSSSASLKSKKGSAASLKEAEAKVDPTAAMDVKSAASLKEAEAKVDSTAMDVKSAASLKETEGNMDSTGADNVKSVASLKEADAKMDSTGAEEVKVDSTATEKVKDGKKSSTVSLTETAATSPKVSATEVATKEASATSVRSRKSSAASFNEVVTETLPKSSYADVAKKFSVHSVETPSLSKQSSPQVSSTEMPTRKASTDSVRSGGKKSSAASVKDALQASPKNSYANVAKQQSSTSIRSMQSAGAVTQSPSKQGPAKLAMEGSVTSVKSQQRSANEVPLTPKVSYAEIVKQASATSVLSKKYSAEVMAVKPKASIVSLKAGSVPSVADKQPSSVSLKKSTESVSSLKYSDVAKGPSAASVKSGQNIPSRASAVDVGSIKKATTSTASLREALATEPIVESATSTPSKEELAVSKTRSKRSVRSSSRKSSAASVNVEPSSPVPSIEITSADNFEEDSKPIVAEPSKASKSSSRSSIKRRSSRSSSHASVKSMTASDEVVKASSSKEIKKTSSRSSVKKGSTSSLKRAPIPTDTDQTAVIVTNDQAASTEGTIPTYASKVSQKSASKEVIKSKSGGLTASMASVGEDKLDATSKSSIKELSSASLKGTVSPKTSAIDALKLADLSSSSFKIRKGSKSSLEKTSPKVSTTSLRSQKSSKDGQSSTMESSS